MRWVVGTSLLVVGVVALLLMWVVGDQVDQVNAQQRTSVSLVGTAGESCKVYKLITEESPKWFVVCERGSGLGTNSVAGLP